MNHDFMTFSSIYISHMMSMPSPGLLLGWAATEHIKANAYCFCYIFYVICQKCIYRSIKFRIIECLSNNEVISAGNQGRFCSVIFGGLG